MEILICFISIQSNVTSQHDRQKVDRSTHRSVRTLSVGQLLFQARELLEECCVIGPLHLESITWYKTTMQERKGHIREILFVLSQSIHRSQVCLASSCKLQGLFLGMLYFKEVVFFYCLLGEFFFETTLNIGLKYFVRTFCFVTMVYYLVTIIVFIVLYW